MLTQVTETNPQSIGREHLIVEELGSELMIYDQKRNQAFCLNQKAAFVWRRCDGMTTIGEIAAQMAQALDEPVNETVVRFALQSLSQDGLLAPFSRLPFVPAGMTRRDVMRKIGVRTAVALPLVTALLVVTPHAHASGKGKGGGGKGKGNGGDGNGGGDGGGNGNGNGGGDGGGNGNGDGGGEGHHHH